MKVLAYGATGSQGAPVVRALLGAGHEVRALTRDPASEDAAALERAGAEVVRGDLADAASLRAASDGAGAVYLLLPFAASDPTALPDWAGNALDAAREAGVQHVIYNASGEIPPAATGNPGLDLRREIVARLERSGLAWLALAPTAYMENFLGAWTAPELTAEGVLAYPLPEAVRMQWIATADVGAWTATALADESVRGRVLSVCGPEALTGPDLAERFGRALGRPVTYRAMPAQEFGRKLDAVYPGMGGMAAQGYAMAYENPEMFSSSVDHAAALETLPIDPTPLEAWVRAHADAFSGALGGESEGAPAGESAGGTRSEAGERA